MSDLWHPLWSERGLPGDGLNTCTGTATDTHRQVVGLLPMLQMNSVTSLSLACLPSPLSFYSLLFHIVEWASTFSSASQYFILLPPHTPPSLSILGMALEILAQSTQTACSLQVEQKADFKQQFHSTDINSYSNLGVLRLCSLSTIDCPHSWEN